MSYVIAKLTEHCWNENDLKADCLAFLLFCKGNDIDLDRNKISACLETWCKLRSFKF
jgi:hypothetical protein